MKSGTLMFVTAITFFIAPSGLPRLSAQEQPGLASAFTVLRAFTGLSGGGNPAATLVRDTAGNLYGTTTSGGNLTCGGGAGCGVVFKLDTTGKETVLHRFTGGTDGSSPKSGLVRDAAGNLYGTTVLGGHCSSCGVVFKLDTTNKETVLHGFTLGADGANPQARLIRDTAGNLYGTASAGGLAGPVNSCPSGCGVVFKLDTTSKETVLHSFTGRADGGAPVSGLVRDNAGNIYGTTFAGGISVSPCFYTCGVVFKLDATRKETVLHRFTGGTDGNGPSAGLVRDSAGNVYGTTRYGGDLTCGGGPKGCGVVFKLDTTGKETVLHRFIGGTDGAFPDAGLLRDAAGNLYGTTRSGGDLSCQCGIVFKLDTTGKETVLHRFTGVVDGADPEAGLVRDTAGNLYGTTFSGGSSACGGVGCGVVFKLTP